MITIGYMLFGRININLSRRILQGSGAGDCASDKARGPQSRLRGIVVSGSMSVDMWLDAAAPAIARYAAI